MSDFAGMGGGFSQSLGGGDMGGGMPQAPAAEPAPSSSQDGEEILKDILELAKDYREVEVDEEDLLKIEKVTTLIQELLAANQKEADGMMQGKVSPRGLRKAYG